MARDRIGEALDTLAGETSRRGFLARAGATLLAGVAGGTVAKVVKPGDADALTALASTIAKVANLESLTVVLVMAGKRP